MTRKLPRAVGRTLADLEGRAEKDEASGEAGASRPKPAGSKTASTGAATGKAKDDESSGPSLAADLALRRARAENVIERHAAYAAVGGLIPIPFAGPAGVAAVSMRMVQNLSEIYGVSFERGLARTVVMSLLGAAAPVAAGALTTAALARFVPGANLFGVAAFALSAVAATRLIGEIVADHFEAGGGLHDLARGLSASVEAEG